MRLFLLDIGFALSVGLLLITPAGIADAEGARPLSVVLDVVYGFVLGWWWFLGRYAARARWRSGRVSDG